MLKILQDRLLKIISGSNAGPADKKEVTKNREGLFGRLLKLGARHK